MKVWGQDQNSQSLDQQSDSLPIALLGLAQRNSQHEHKQAMKEAKCLIWTHESGVAQSKLYTISPLANAFVVLKHISHAIDLLKFTINP